MAGPHREAEARRAYQTEQRRRRYRHNQDGADAVAVRFAQLLQPHCEQLLDRALQSRVDGPHHGRLPELAGRAPDGVTAWAGIA